MSLMMSSCCTFRLNRRSALSIDSPSWIFTSATDNHTPFTGGSVSYDVLYHSTC